MKNIRINAAALDDPNIDWGQDIPVKKKDKEEKKEKKKKKKKKKKKSKKKEEEKKKKVEKGDDEIVIMTQSVEDPKGTIVTALNEVNSTNRMKILACIIYVAAKVHVYRLSKFIVLQKLNVFTQMSFLKSPNMRFYGVGIPGDDFHPGLNVERSHQGRDHWRRGDCNNSRD